MENWAIVIGVNQYWKPSVCLNGAVRDAEKMMAWLLREDGGNVPPRNLYLLTDPLPQSTPVPGVRLLQATRRNIVIAIRQLISRSEGAGERFYFHFSGHGLATVVNYTLYNGIIPSDFDDVETTKAINLQSLYNRFLSTRFQEQFFFIDACRNIPFKEPFIISELDRPVEPMVPFPPQFIMYATSSGLKATEVNEQGAFTGALLEGLAGKGTAKVFSDDEQGYLVTWESLFKYVEDQVKKRRIEIGTDLIQEPKRETREQTGVSPVLGRYPAGSFENENLVVNLVPGEIAPTAEIVIGHLGGEVERRSAPGELPLQFSLQPRLYSLRAAAADHKAGRPYYPIELYSPTYLDVNFTEEAISVTEWNRLMNFEDAESRRGLESVRTGRATIRSWDQLARLALYDGTGQKKLLEGEGVISTPSMPPGFYRARMYTPEGIYSEQLIELFPGENEPIEIDAPPPQDSPLFRELTGRTGIELHANNMVEPSEAMGPVGTAQASTLLALAAGAANEREEESEYYGYKLRQTGVSSFQALTHSEATSGVQIILGIDANDWQSAQEYLSRIRLSCWSQDDEVPPDVLPPEPGPVSIPLPVEWEFHHPPQPPHFIATMPGIGEYAWEKAPGAYWLSVETPDQEPVAFAVSVLPDRLSLVVFTRYQDGQTELFQYLPSLVPGDPRDSRQDLARFPILQRSELIQRAYFSNRLEEPDRNAQELLYAKWIEPVAGALGGYILLKLNPHHDLLPVAVNNMSRSFAGLCDSHVLKGTFDSLQESRVDRVMRSYQNALGAGLPIFSEGLSYLVKGIERTGLEHPMAGVFSQISNHQVPGMPWTAVSVRELAAIRR